MITNEGLNTLRINDSCINCGSCVDVCPVDAISQGDDIYIIDEEKCLICSQCLEVCPTQAMDPVVNGKLFQRSHS